MREKQLTRSQLQVKVQELKAANKTIATLNGSFDLLHAGHLHILFEAASQADVLIVALNTDASIKRYKGEHRPICTLEERMAMMAALECVDYVTSFDEDTPIETLKIIQPNVHVNGAEYGENCIESGVVKAHGGRIHIVDLVPGLSTSKLIERIVQCV
ncbi:MAG: adenylyltransferase/cytidyltransferase family protein [Chlamydiales bacterium]|nr:adenylyltransferase/cytidyltransferase family protein [Chlamydiales bacterium]